MTSVLDHLPVYILTLHSDQRDPSCTSSPSSTLQALSPSFGISFQKIKSREKASDAINIAGTSVHQRTASFKINMSSWGGIQSFKVNKLGTLIQMLLY